MRSIRLFFFPEYTKWEIIDVFTDHKAYFCLQVRANKHTGLKQFRTTCALDSTYSVQLKEFTNERINHLTGFGKKIEALAELKKTIIFNPEIKSAI